MVAVVIVLLIVSSFSAYRSLSQARRLLNQAHVTITTSIGNESDLTSPSGRTKALLGVAQVSADAAQAEQDLHSSFGLSVLGVLPLLHTQRDGLLQLVDNLRASATTGGVLIRQVDALASASAGTNIAIPQLRELQTTVAAAHKQFASYDRPSTGLWGPLGTAQREFDREDVKITQLLADGNRAMSYALPFLGTDGPRTYLVMGENNAEMRDEGSTLSYSLLHTSNGVITESPGGSVDNIEPTSPVPGVPIPAGTEADFGELDPTGIWQSTNATADFTFSGLDMDRMLADTTGVQVNGVIGIDVVALEALLGLTGPVTVAGIPEPVTSQNAAYVLLDQLYAGLPAGSSQGSRREALAAVASAVFHQLGVQKIDVIALARTLATETTERHLQLWDSNSRYERTIHGARRFRGHRHRRPHTDVSRRRGKRHRDETRLLRRRGDFRHGHHLFQWERHRRHVGETDQSRAGRATPELPTRSRRRQFLRVRRVRRPGIPLGTSWLRAEGKCGRVGSLTGQRGGPSRDAG